MILSMGELDLSSPGIRQCLKNAHDMHRTVMKLFAQAETPAARQELGVLYRVQRTPRGIRLYILSKQAPQRACEGIALESKPVDAAVASLTTGRQLRFDLLALPSKKLPRPDGNSRRVALATPQERLAWLQNMGEKHGFEVLWAREEAAERIAVQRRKADAAFALQATHFAGMLRIVQAGAFQKAYCAGLGPEKAYGLGMLLLARG